MPKIKLIKRDLLAELGDEFEVLSDTDAAESGLTVPDDSVLVMEKPAPSGRNNSGGDNEELKNLRDRLHTVNQESAQRRIALREAQDQLKQVTDELKGLRTTVDVFKTNEAKTKAKQLFTEHVTEKKLEFISAEAGDDLRDQVFGQVDWTKSVTKETLAPMIDELVGKKKYILKTATLPRTDGGKQSDPAGDTVDIDLNAIAAEFGIAYKETDKKES